MLLTSKGSFIISSKGFGVNSQYQVQPLSGAQVPTGVPYIWRLELYNPHDAPLKVIEAISSDRFMSLAPPKEEPGGYDQNGGGGGGGGGGKGKNNGVALGGDGTSSNVTGDEEDGTTFQYSENHTELAMNAVAAVAKANAKAKTEEVTAAAVAKPGRKFPLSAVWELPAGASRTILVVKLLLPRSGRFEGTIRITLKRTDTDTDTATVELRVPVQVDAASNGVFRSPDQVDFGVSTRRLDRLKQTVTLFNGGPHPVHITDVQSRPNDPSLRVRYNRGESLAPYAELPSVSLTYSGKLEGIRMGTLLIRTNNSNEAMEVPYRARVLHGKLAHRLEEMSFMSPDKARVILQLVRSFILLVSYPLDSIRFIEARLMCAHAGVYGQTLVVRLFDHRVPGTHVVFTVRHWSCDCLFIEYPVHTRCFTRFRRRS